MTMKNVHVIPTDKPSRLHLGNSGLVLCDLYYSSNTINSQHIYITNSEEIKEGDCSFYPPFGVGKNIVIDGELCFHIEAKDGKGRFTQRTYQTLDRNKKIILTTDQSLDGVQAIDDTFLEWFIKNPSCEEVEVGYGWIRLTETDNEGYWVSIPNKQFEMQQEEHPKQETLEEAADLWSIDLNNVHPADSYIAKTGFIAGANWMQEQIKNESTADYIDRHIVQAMVETAKQKMYSEEEVLQLLLKLQQTEFYDNLYDWFEQNKKK